jgi:hypothetical protein
VTAHAPAVTTGYRWPFHSRGPATTRWLRDTLSGVIALWIAATVLPQILGLSGAWRAFGAGLVVPGAGLLYAIPPLHHSFSTGMVLGHAAVVAAEVAALAWALRRYPVIATGVCLLAAAALALGVSSSPAAVVVAGHVAGFLGVLIACGWAFGIRLIGRADFTTLPAIVVASAAVSAALVSTHGHMPGPLVWIPWAALGLAIGSVIAMLGRGHLQYRAARRIGRERLNYLDGRNAQTGRSAQTDIRPLQNAGGAPQVTEASPEQLQLLRYLLAVAMQPADNWDSFDRERTGPLQQYRYQVNALGWALSTYGYSHAPSLTGPLVDAQLALFDRMQQKAVWGYWYWQNVLGNWDFIKRRADPIDVPQNIMFTGYLNLQLAMFRQATGDHRFDREGALAFEWSPKQRFTFNHNRINDIVIRNFQEDLCLWPCEPVPLRPTRKRGFVFPYCNAVATAGAAVTDALNGTQHAHRIAARLEESMNREFTSASGELVTFITSGFGITVRIVSGPANSAAVAGLIVPLCPDLAWRTWEILRRDWLETGRYRTANSAGGENPDWGTGAKTNAESLAASMLLARECGESQWHAELWRTAIDQLHFSEDSANPGMCRFADASVHANGMLGFGGFGRLRTLTDMMTRQRPSEWTNGPRLIDLPHPNALVAKAVSDGSALDVVLRPGSSGGRMILRFDQFRPRASYVVHGAEEHEIVADEGGHAEVSVDLEDRTAIGVRPA